MSRYDVVCFDFWNTIMFEGSVGALVAARLPVMREALQSDGHDIAIEQLQEAHAEAQRTFEAAWALNAQFTTWHAARIMADHLGLREPAAAVIDEAFSAGSAVADIRLVDGAREAVTAARAHGARTAIVCDIGLTPSPVILAWLRVHGLAGAFDCMAFSDRIGVYKPSPAIFDHVFSALGLEDPVTALHVGDRLRTDVAGARQRGMLAVRYRGVFDDADELPEADVVIDSMHDMAALLMPES